MGIFQRKKKSDAQGFFETGIAATAVSVDQMTRVKLNGETIVLSRWQNELIAFNDICPHGAAAFSNGSIRGWQVSCPEHGYCFDIRNGRITWPEDEVYRLKRYPVKVEADMVKIKLS